MVRRHGCAKSRNRPRGVIRRHLKFMGVQNTTLARHALAVERFWAFCDFSVGHVPRSARELDLYLGEYINHLFHDGCPFKWGCNTLAAVRRFLPSWRDGTFLAKSYLRKWSRTQDVRRAVPLSLEVLLGFCGFRALFGRWHVVSALFVGFLCLLRTGEILSLKAGQITLSVDSGVVLLAFQPLKAPNSRTWVS